MSRLRSLILIMIAEVALCDAVRAASPLPQTFETGGVKLAYVEAGKGSTVVLIHGLHASAMLNWQLVGVFDALAEHHHVVALDLPGHGNSDKPEKDEAYGEQLAADVVALLDHLKVEKAHLVGYSLGGMVAIKTAVKYPKKIESLCVCGMGWLQSGGIPDKLEERMPSLTLLGVPKACVRNMNKLAVTEAELKAIKIPAEIVVGADDALKKIFVEPLTRVRKDWPLVEIPGAGHITCVAKPEFKEELLRWTAARTK
ncbi:MAG: alpha/beta fold hydrolase [Pirellulales bacterium]